MPYESKQIKQVRAQAIEAARARLHPNRPNVFPLITGSSGATWAVPIPFDDIALPAFPVATLPPWLRDYVKEMATAIPVPVDLMAALGLGVVATACAKRVWVRVRTDWRESLNLYLAATLSSGEGKTPAFRHATKPIRDFQDQKLEGIKDEIRAAELRQSILETQLKRLIRDTTKQTASAADAQAKVYDVDKELRDLVVPPTPRLVVEDVTTPALAIVMAENDGRIALLSDEAGIFGTLGGANSARLDLWLKSWDGSEVHVDRVGRPAIHLREPLLTVLLTPQPIVLEGLAVTPAFRGRGLIARFLFVVPKSLVGYRNEDAPPAGTIVTTEYHQRVTALLRQQPGELALSAGAYGELMEFRREIEVQLQPYGSLAEMADWANKLPGTTARLAGLLHMADHAGDRTPFEISEWTMARAIEVAHYLIPHTRAAFMVMAADKTVGPAKWVLGYIMKTQTVEFSVRDLCQALHRKVAWLKPVLKTLEEHGYIRPKPAPAPRAAGGRPPGPVYELNPAAMVS